MDLVFDRLFTCPYGITVDWKDGSVYYGFGYIVGGGEPSLIVPHNLDMMMAYSKFIRWMEGLNYDYDYVGAWVDEGLRYIDAVDIFSNKEKALQVASNRGELAIYDAFNKKTIYVGGNDGS